MKKYEYKSTDWENDQYSGDDPTPDDLERQRLSMLRLWVDMKWHPSRITHDPKFKKEYIEYLKENNIQI